MKYYCYAEIDRESICIGVIKVIAPRFGENLIEVLVEDFSEVVGKRRVNHEWVEVDIIEESQESN